MTLERMPALLLRLEGIAVLAASIAIYLDQDFSVLAFVLLALAPDLSFLGYLGGPRMGAFAYNAVHTYVLPVTLAVIGVVADADTAVQLALIWSAHIGADRALGYGLKYPSAIRGSHLQRV